MRESVTYQMILKEGFEEGYKKGFEEGYKRGFEEGYKKGFEEGLFNEARKLVSRYGTKRLDPPDPTIIAEIEAIHELEIVEALLDRVPDSDGSSWTGLLDS